MNTKAKVLKKKGELPLIEFWSDGNDSDREPDEIFTRIWMGIVPPDNEPGYVCIIGEIWDGEFEQKARPKILLDEGIALDPDDFNDEDRRTWSRLLFTNDGATPRKERPTLEDLRHAAVALKDIYSAASRDPILAFLPPGESNAQFFQYMIATWGFTYPGKRDDEEWQRWYPFFRSQEYRLGMSNQPPFGDNGEYAQELVESLLAGRELRISARCDHFLTPSLVNPRKCVGMVLASMQMIDWSFRLNEYREDDAYEDWRDNEEEREEADLARQIQGRMWAAGLRSPGLHDARGPYRDNADPYLKTRPRGY